MKISSPSFQESGVIPDKFSKNGQNVNPALKIEGAPAEAKSLLLIVDDPDATSGVFVHWLLYGIPPAITELDEGVPATVTLPNGARQGRNGFGDLGYGGPQPPSGTHRYFFHLYALDYELPLRAGASREEIDRAIQGHTIEKAELMGRFQHRSRAKGGQA